MGKGYVYVLSNPSFSWLKIGYSKHGGKSRAKALSKETGVPFPYRLEWEIEVLDAKAVENAVHNQLSEYRVNDAKEFFDCSVESAKASILELQNTVSPVKVSRKTKQNFTGYCKCGCARDRYGCCPDCYNSYAKETNSNYTQELIKNLRLENIALKDTINRILAIAYDSQFKIENADNPNSCDIAYLVCLIENHRKQTSRVNVLVDLDRFGRPNELDLAIKLAHIGAIELTKNERGEWKYCLNSNSKGWVEQHYLTNHGRDCIYE